MNATAPRTARPILHVHIVDDLTGDLLADVDAASTADGLAYYLRSRHIADDATEEQIRSTIAAPPGYEMKDDELVLFERRHPITNVLEIALFAEVEGAKR